MLCHLLRKIDTRPAARRCTACPQRPAILPTARRATLGDGFRTSRRTLSAARRSCRAAAFTLIELLIVIAVIGVLVAMMVPSSVTSLHDQLRGTARIVATDLAYARSLAVGNGDKYQFTFDTANNCYTLQYSGTNTALRTLPRSQFSSPSDPATQHIVNLSSLPHFGGATWLVAVATTGGSVQQVSDLEFGPLGATTRSSATTIWLAAGRSPATRYLTVSVNPATGLADIGGESTSGPPSGIDCAAPPAH